MTYCGDTVQSVLLFGITVQCFACLTCSNTHTGGSSTTGIWKMSLGSPSAHNDASWGKSASKPYNMP